MLHRLEQEQHHAVPENDLDDVSVLALTIRWACATFGVEATKASLGMPITRKTMPVEIIRLPSAHP